MAVVPVEDGSLIAGAVHPLLLVLALLGAAESDGSVQVVLTVLV